MASSWQVVIPAQAGIQSYKYHKPGLMGTSGLDPGLRRDDDFLFDAISSNLAKPRKKRLLYP
ncbi:MAG: hypothetical protein P4M15_01180 [Alphaproteobacteria bacterium]|nr:hypothetical protein [Alphaproteobacteria bacterium]